MVNDVTAVSGFCIAGAIISVLLKQYCKEQSMMISLGVCVGIFLTALGIISPILEKTEEIFINAGISHDYIIIIFKAMAVCFMTQITSDLCRDSGESAIGSVMEMWGRISVTLMSLPILESLTDIISELLSF